MHYGFIYRFSGSLSNLKRNQVKLNDNVIALQQEKEEERKERQLLIDLIRDLREEVKLLVTKKKKNVFRIGDNVIIFF